MNAYVRGDFSKLLGFTRKLSDFRRALEDVADSAAEEAVKLVAEGFQQQSDPYGNEWKPKRHDDGRSVLVGKTARLRRGWHWKRTGVGKRRVYSNVDYAIYHQDGTRGRHSEQTQHRVQPYANDFIQAGKLGTRRGRFISRKQARKLGRGGSAIAVHSFKITFGIGSGKIPVRAMVPDSRGIPQAWSDRMGKAARDAIAEWAK